MVAALTLDVLSWAVLATYVVHLLDETLINGGFVNWVSTNFWPSHTMRMFFWFNAGAVVLIGAGNIAFDLFGGHLVVLPLFWIAGFTLHGMTVHVFWTIRQRSYSPGLVTAGAVVLGGFLTFGPTVLFPALNRSRS